MGIFVVKQDRFKVQALKRALGERDKDGKLKITSAVPLSAVMPEGHRTLKIEGENGVKVTLTLDGSRQVYMPSQSACIVRVFPVETKYGVNVHLTSGCFTFCADEPILKELKAPAPTSRKRPVKV